MTACQPEPDLEYEDDESKYFLIHLFAFFLIIMQMNLSTKMRTQPRERNETKLPKQNKTKPPKLRLVVNERKFQQPLPAKQQLSLKGSKLREAVPVVAFGQQTSMN
jgi:hypothetical protein